MSSISRTRVLTWNEGSLEERADELAVEEPLEIRIGGESTAVTMRTPGHDTELVAGMLLTEGLIDSSMLPLIRQEAPNTVNVALQGLRLNPKRLESIRRAQAISSSCGLCGKSSIEAIHQHFPPIHGEMTFDPSVLVRLLDTLESSQITFAQTGGVHAAAIFDVAGDLIV